MMSKVRKRENRDGAGFRLVRCFGVDHNIRRLRAYIRRIERTPDMVRLKRRTRLKKRIRAVRGAPGGKG